MYPALYPFGSKARWLSFLSHCVTQDHYELERCSQLLDRQLIPLLRGSELGLFLGISPRLVTHMAKFPKGYYRNFFIPKKSGGRREITAPRVFLKTVQRYIADCILLPNPTHPSAFGFIRTKNPGDGANLHVGHQFVWNIDIRNFFPSIVEAQVMRQFSELNYPESAARILTNLCCLTGKLPQGAPTSPGLSNLVFAPTDAVLSDFSSQNGLVYSRYADDLTFSGNSPVAEPFRAKVTTIIEAAGFALNSKKTRLMGPRTRREVTGLTVNSQVSVPRMKRRALRAYFHQVSLRPSEFSAQKDRAVGYAAWIFDFHPAEGRRYLEIARRIPTA